MNRLTQLLSYSCLLIVSQYLYASILDITLSQKKKEYIDRLLSQKKKEYIVLLTQQQRNLLVTGYIREANIIISFCRTIQYFLQDNPSQYMGKKLPADLSGEDLQGFNFTGCDFGGTNLENTNLNNTILKDTTCKHQPFSLKNVLKVLKEQNKGTDIVPLGLYIRVVGKLLVNISKVYLKLEGSEKAKLLTIASGFVFIPFLKKEKFDCHHHYYIAKLVELKLANKGCQELNIPLLDTLQLHFKKSCWETTYKENNNLIKRILHTDFSQYANDFEKGLLKYTNHSELKGSDEYFKKPIIGYIKKLESLYEVNKDKKDKQELLKEVLSLTKALSVSYQYGKEKLHIHYQTCKKRLIELNIS